nr:glucose-6-phosphate isomerase 1, chloroplastic [Ipomoea batatas]
MAAASSVSAAFKPEIKSIPKLQPIPVAQSPFQKPSVPLCNYKLRFRAQSVAREVPAGVSSASGNNDVILKSKAAEEGILKDPRQLWKRYVDWLYQHKELGLYLDVNRVGFSDDFVAQMEPRLQKAFKDMETLEKGAISNPDEGRMVGHYWLRSPHLSPNSFLRLQIENTLEAVCKFADDVVDGKIRTPSGGRFTQILSVGICGSALGPQFVAEALAPDNPPLKIVKRFQLLAMILLL